MSCPPRGAGRTSRGSPVSEALPDDVALLHGLVAIPSVHPNEGEAVAYLCAEMAKRGFRTYVDDAGNAIGEIGDGPLHIVMLGHIDTVPGVVPVRIAGDDLYGRGSVDAKGPLATFVAATGKAHRDRLLDGLRVTVIGATGEEAHSPGANYLAKTMPAPDACIIGEPGAWESIVMGYKGSMQLQYTRAQPNTHGAGQQWPAPQHAASVWNGVEAWCNAWNEGRTREFDRVTPILRGFSSRADGITQEAMLDINIRIPPDLAPEEIVNALPSAAFPFALRGTHGEEAPSVLHDGSDFTQGRASLRETHAAFRLAESPIPAYRCDKNTPLVRALLAGVRQVGGTPRFKVKTGTADMNVVGPVWQCQMAAYGPGDSSQDHTPDEHLSLAEYARAVDALAAALGALARG